MNFFHLLALNGMKRCIFHAQPAGILLWSCFLSSVFCLEVNYDPQQLPGKQVQEKQWVAEFSSWIAIIFNKEFNNGLKTRSGSVKNHHKLPSLSPATTQRPSATTAGRNQNVTLPPLRMYTIVFAGFVTQLSVNGISPAAPRGPLEYIDIQSQQMERVHSVCRWSADSGGFKQTISHNKTVSQQQRGRSAFITAGSTAASLVKIDNRHLLRATHQR